MGTLLVGLMSGTSVDGVDAALVYPDTHPPRLLAARTTAVPGGLRQGLLRLTRPGTDALDDVARMDAAVARLFAVAVARVLEAAGVSASRVRAIGSHGQTVRHCPDGPEPYTVQIGNPSLIAELTGITTVADFRRRDMAAGGQGAPLAPAFHAAFFRTPDEDRAVVNIGGIANITLLPAACDSPVTGFDTGPGNALLDAWAERHLGSAIDEGGIWAAGGRVVPALLEACLDEPYFAAPPPKSSGRELFHLDWLQARLDRLQEAVAPRDAQATLAELTATTIAGALRRHAPATQRLLVCGGGVHNRALLERLGDRLDGVAIESTTRWGVDADYLEAIGFAWLAGRTLAGEPGNLPAVTGARGPRILGGIYPA